MNLDDKVASLAEAEFRTAVGVARAALAAYNAQPLVPRPRRNPAFVCWRDEATE